jgi:hypothetical protein
MIGAHPTSRQMVGRSALSSSTSCSKASSRINVSSGCG